MIFVTIIVLKKIMIIVLVLWKIYFFIDCVIFPRQCVQHILTGGTVDSFQAPGHFQGGAPPQQQMMGMPQQYGMQPPMQQNQQYNQQPQYGQQPPNPNQFNNQPQYAQYPPALTPQGYGQPQQPPMQQQQQQPQYAPIGQPQQQQQNYGAPAPNYGQPQQQQQQQVS
jgi:hypothetical protein